MKEVTGNKFARLGGEKAPFPFVQSSSIVCEVRLIPHNQIQPRFSKIAPL